MKTEDTMGTEILSMQQRIIGLELQVDREIESLLSHLATIEAVAKLAEQRLKAMIDNRWYVEQGVDDSGLINFAVWREDTIDTFIASSYTPEAAIDAAIKQLKK